LKRLRDTRVETVHLVLPEYANPSGNLYGGRMMYWITETAYLAASRLARGPVVLGSMDGIDFLSPVRIGQVVTLLAEVEFVGRSAMEVGVLVYAEDPNTRKRHITTLASMGYVAVDQEGRPRPVPEKVKPADAQEQERHEMARKRRELRQQRLKQHEHRALDRQATAWAPFPYTLEYTRLVFPEDTLTSRIMFAGRLFLDLDQAASILALRFVRGPVVTASIDTTDFYEPIRQGDILNLQLAITYTGRTSLEIHARVMAEQPMTGELRFASSSFLTFVAVDREGRPRPLPRRLVPLSEGEKRAVEAAEARKAFRRQRAQQVRTLLAHFSPQILGDEGSSAFRAGKENHGARGGDRA